MKEKIKSIVGTIFTIIIFIFLFLWNVTIVSVKDGEEHCHNFFGYTVKCR